MVAEIEEEVFVDSGFKKASRVRKNRLSTEQEKREEVTQLLCLRNLSVGSLSFRFVCLVQCEDVSLFPTMPF